MFEIELHSAWSWGLSVSNASNISFLFFYCSIDKVVCVI